MANIAKKDIPALIRKNYELWRVGSKDLRTVEEERLKFYAGGDGQWRDSEITKRKNQGRPFISINKCKPAVDQVEGDIRSNPPGPKVLPVGDGADPDTADIHEGLIREIEHRSNAQLAYITASRYQAASGYGVIELTTEYVSDTSFEQQLRIDACEDPAMWFFDPNARRVDRKDALWAGKIRLYTKEEYIAQFGKNRAILKDRTIQSALGFMQDTVGVNGNLAQINEWTGSGKGPYFVVEYYHTEFEPTKLLECSDNVNRFEDEPLPKGAKYKTDGLERLVQRRKITKYITDAMEVLDEVEWLGNVVPAFPVLGQEVYISGKLYRMSLISEAMDAQRALNYTATTATELAGLMPKAPFIGFKGQFDDPRWQTANSEVWAYLEVEPVFAVNPTNNQSELLPPPQRNTWESPIQWLLALAQYFSEAIKATTAIYDASLGNNKADQSGTAIQQLRTESNAGTFFVTDNLHHSINALYEQIILINCQLLDGPRVQTIVRADSQHELVTINKEFPQGVDPKTGKQSKGKWLNQGRYAVVVTVGPNLDTLKEKTSVILTEFLKIDPQIMAIPGVAAMALRSIAQGDPQVEGIADLLEPQSSQSPQQVAMQLQQAKKTIQQYELVITKLQQDIAAKTPQVQADLRKAALSSLTAIRVAEINASKDADSQKADIDAAHVEQVLGMAHETALESQKQQHEKDVMNQQGALDSQQSTQDAVQGSLQSSQDAGQDSQASAQEAQQGAQQSQLETGQQAALADQEARNKAKQSESDTVHAAQLAEQKAKHEKDKPKPKK